MVGKWKSPTTSSVDEDVKQVRPALSTDGAPLGRAGTCTPYDPATLLLDAHPVYMVTFVY